MSYQSIAERKPARMELRPVDTAKQSVANVSWVESFTDSPACMEVAACLSACAWRQHCSRENRGSQQFLDQTVQIFGKFLWVCAEANFTGNMC